MGAARRPLDEDAISFGDDAEHLEADVGEGRDEALVVGDAPRLVQGDGHAGVFGGVVVRQMPRPQVQVAGVERLDEAERDLLVLFRRGGDAVLRCLALVLGECTRADYLVARYGGDEFVMLLGGSVEDAMKAAERVREKVEFECVPQDEVFLDGSLTVSVGVASLGEDTATLQGLIRAADGELYRAKASGKNMVAAAGM